MVSSFFSSSLLIIFLLYISSLSCSLTQPLTGVKLPLIHRLSLPGHSNETFQQLVETHLKQLDMEFATLDDQEQINVDTPMLKFDNAVYFVNVTIGNPPVPQYLVVDTGSSVTWVVGHLVPPRQYEYYPLKSYTFTYVSCYDPICTSNPINFMCLGKKINKCGYEAAYADGTRSAGVIGHDQFRFVKFADRSSRDSVKLLFGCLGSIENSTDAEDPNFYGIMGLGPRNMSVVNQLPAPKLFSYCVSNLSSPETVESEGYIHFGKVNDYTGDLATTPIHQGYGTYIVEIQSICLDDVCLAIDPTVFKLIPGVKSGASMDTGAILSYLADKACDAVEEAVIKMMSSKNLNYVPDLYLTRKKPRLCYQGKLPGKESAYPILTINFAGDGGAKMIITRNEYLYDIGNEYHCLTFLRSSSRLGKKYKNYSIIGLVTQQYHVFEYDLDNWNVGILSETLCNDVII